MDNYRQGSSPSPECCCNCKEGRQKLWNDNMSFQPHLYRYPSLVIQVPCETCSYMKYLNCDTLQVRTGMEACTGAARRSVHFLRVFQGPPSGCPPGRCLAHPHPLEMPMNLLQPRVTWSACWTPLCMRLSHLRESAKQDHRQEKEPHNHAAAADGYGLTIQVTNLIRVSLINRS